MLYTDHSADAGTFLSCAFRARGVCLTFSDAASAGLPLTTVPEGSVFSAYQYLLPFEQKHESQWKRDQLPSLHPPLLGRLQQKHHQYSESLGQHLTVKVQIGCEHAAGTTVSQPKRGLRTYFENESEIGFRHLKNGNDEANQHMSGVTYPELSKEGAPDWSVHKHQPQSQVTVRKAGWTWTAGYNPNHKECANSDPASWFSTRVMPPCWSITMSSHRSKFTFWFILMVTHGSCCT